MGNLTIKPASGGLLKLQDAGSTDRIQITDGGSTVLYEDDGNAALTIDTDGNTVIADGNRIQTDEVRAYDGAGLKLYDDGGKGIFVEDGGDVGIGAASPSALLHLSDNDVNVNLYVQNTNGSGQTWAINSNNLGKFNIHDTLVNHLTIDSSGNVGIGIAAPAYKLDVQSTTSADEVVANFENDINAAGEHALIRCGHSSLAAYMGQYLGTTDVAYFSGDADPVNLKGIYITNAGGNVGIGDSTPSYQLELSTNSAAKPTSTLWTVPSDERLKNNIELADLDICYDVVKNLPLKRYTWKDDVYTEKQTNDRSVLGWIAQDVKTVFPKSVKENNFKGISNNDGVSAVEAQEKLEWTDKPTDENTKDEIKAWMDSNSLEYNSDDTKADLIAKIPELKQEAIEAVEAIEETFKLEIEDCLSIDADQIFRAMFGAIQKLQTKVEALENA